jgi:hypothetical protein
MRMLPRPEGARPISEPRPMAINYSMPPDLAAVAVGFRCDLAARGWPECESSQAPGAVTPCLVDFTVVRASSVVFIPVAAIAALALVVMAVQCPRFARANPPTESQIAGSEPELICSPRTGNLPDEPTPASPGGQGPARRVPPLSARLRRRPSEEGPARGLARRLPLLQGRQRRRLPVHPLRRPRPRRPPNGDRTPGHGRDLPPDAAGKTGLLA